MAVLSAAPACCVTRAKLGTWKKANGAATATAGARGLLSVHEARKTTTTEAVPWREEDGWEGYQPHAMAIELCRPVPRLALPSLASALVCVESRCASRFWLWLWRWLTLTLWLAPLSFFLTLQQSPARVSSSCVLSCLVLPAPPVQVGLRSPC